MKHQFFIDRLSSYVDGQLSAEESLKLKEHIASCEECKKSYNNIVKMQKVLNMVGDEERSEAFDLKLESALLDRKDQINLGRRKTDKILVDLGKIAWSRHSLKAASALVAATIMFAVGLNIFISRPKGFAYTVVASRGLVQVYSNAQSKWLSAAPGMVIDSKDTIKLAGLAQADIVSKRLCKIRLKQNSEAEFIQLAKNFDSTTSINIKRGKALIKTVPGFKGSKLNIITPSAKTEVLGTALMVGVSPDTKATWVGVLKGVVAVEGLGISANKEHLNRVLVKEGHKTSVKPGQVPSLPEIFSDKEWEMMDEMYRIGDLPQVALLIGTDSNRVEELLAPCMLFVYDEPPRKLPEEIEDIILSIKEAVDNDNMELHKQTADRLHNFIIRHPNKLYDVQFLLFLGAYYYFIEDYNKSIELFNKVIDGYPDSKLQSLAICAKAFIYEKTLKDIKKARQLYQDILDFYSNTPEADYAKKALARLK